MLTTIMNIADSFYHLNDILINNNKAVLLSNNAEFNNTVVTFNVNNKSIPIKVKSQMQPVRVLGVWVTISRQKKHIIQQIKDEIAEDVALLQYKKVTDKQLLYIFNAVIVPRIEYRAQITFLSEEIYESLTAPYRVLFKHKLNMNRCTPNSMMHNTLIYNFRKLYNNQIQAMFTNLCVQLNDPMILGRSTSVRLLQLQKKYWLNESPLVKWPFNKQHNFQDHIAELLTVMPDFNLSFATDPLRSSIYSIHGGYTYLMELLPEKSYL